MAIRSDRVAGILAREVLFSVACLLLAWLFLNHEVLYLRSGFRPVVVPAESYVLTFLVVYAFVRGFAGLVGWRAPRPRRGDCPECGRPRSDWAPNAPARRAVADSRAALLLSAHAPRKSAAGNESSRHRDAA